MFFKFKRKKTDKKESMQPTKEQVELYGKHIYSILSDSGELTPFDELVCGAFTYFWMIEKSGQSQFLTANPIAKIDAIIATAYMNALIFINGVSNTEIKQQYTSIYFKKNIQVICQEYPAFSSFIGEMFSSRINLYNAVTEKHGSDLQATIDSVFEELQYVLPFDKEERTYKPYTQDSPLVLLGFSDLMTCQGEIGAYKNVYNTLYEATNQQINQVLLSLDSDTVSPNDNDVPICYAALQNALFAGLEEYIKRNPSPVLVRFCQSLEQHFNSFLNGEPVEEYSFSISVRNEFCLEYVDFNFEESVIEVSCGGSVYSPDVGSDSYTNWFYAIWDDGSEENEEVYAEFFNIIYEILKSENSTITISEPDQFYYFVESE